MIIDDKKEVSVNTNSDHKSTIAKLLATENIHVVHKKTQTASFNVATRELVLLYLKIQFPMTFMTCLSVMKLHMHFGLL